MNKTFGLLALTVGLVAGGCALLPNGPVAHLNLNDGKVSGPVTLTVNIPQNLRSVQGLRSGVRMVEVFALTATGQDLAKRAGGTVFATASVSGTGAAATITLPSLPADGSSYFLVINGYSSTSVASASLMATIMDTATDSFLASNTTTSSASYIVAQTEALVTPVPGVGIPLSVNMYNCVSPAANLNYNGGDPTGMVYSSSISGVTAPSAGLPVRWFAWPYADSATGLVAPSPVVRLTAYRPTGTWGAGPYTQTGTNAATVSWGCWDTASDSLAATASSWTIDSTGKYAYMDIDFNIGTQNTASKSIRPGNGSNLSVIVPSGFLPTGYTLSLTDSGNPVSLPGNGTL